MEEESLLSSRVWSSLQLDSPSWPVPADSGLWGYLQHRCQAAAKAGPTAPPSGRVPEIGLQPKPEPLDCNEKIPSASLSQLAQGLAAGEAAPTMPLPCT